MFFWLLVFFSLTTISNVIQLILEHTRVEKGRLIMNIKKFFIAFFITVFLFPLQVLAYSNQVILGGESVGIHIETPGVMVIGFYHPYECIFSDSVKRFHLKSHEDNAYILLFMKVVILQQKSKFGYLYKFNAERMEHTRIMLPVDNEGNIDYEYMEQYAKNMMIKKYKQYLAFLDDKEKGARVQIP